VGPLSIWLLFVSVIPNPVGVVVHAHMWRTNARMFITIINIVKAVRFLLDLSLNERRRYVSTVQAKIIWLPIVLITWMMLMRKLKLIIG
jgi:hypothetical protein